MSVSERDKDRQENLKKKKKKALGRGNKPAKICINYVNYSPHETS